VYGDLLFATYSYIGDDLEADGSRLAQSPACQRWNAAMARLQEPVSEATSGSWFDLEPIYLLAR
jgi:L-rhamnose mutarotase